MPPAYGSTDQEAPGSAEPGLDLVDPEDDADPGSLRR
jgi:hypothetical protein